MPIQNVISSESVKVLLSLTKDTQVIIFDSWGLQSHEFPEPMQITCLALKMYNVLVTSIVGCTEGGNE